MYKRYLSGFLAIFFLSLIACSALVYYVDPSFHYHALPRKNIRPVYLNERYQNAGLAKQLDYDTVIVGSSVTANFRVSQFDALFDAKTLKLTFPGGCFADFETALDLAFSTHDVKRVFWSLDPKILMAAYDDAPTPLPAYLYNNNPFDDGKYLLNKDVLLEQTSKSILSTIQGKSQSLDEAFTWDHKYEFSAGQALWGYVRPDWVETPADPSAYDDIIDENLNSVLSFVQAHPDTEFYLFTPPYSVLYWDRVLRDGSYTAVLSLLDRLLRELPQYENVHYYCFSTDLCTLYLDNYIDEVHYSPEINRYMAETMATTPDWSEKNRPVMEYFLRQLVEKYNYDSQFPEVLREEPRRVRTLPPASEGRLIP